MDARELVSLIELDSCPRRLGLARSEVKPSEIRRYFELSEREISRLAADNGRDFENRLTSSKAAAGPLRDRYRREHGIDIAPEDVLGLGSNDQSIALAEERLSEERGMIVQARLRFRFAGMDITLEPDILVWDPRVDAWRVGEIKSYAYAGRLTDPKKTASAAAQAAYAIIALERGGHRVRRDEVDLVFTSASEYRGARWLSAEMRSIGVADVLHGIEALERRLSAAEPLGLEAAAEAPIVPCAECRSSCPLWERCGAELAARGSVWGSLPSVAGAADETMDDLAADADVAFASSLLR